MRKPALGAHVPGSRSKPARRRRSVGPGARVQLAQGKPLRPALPIRNGTPLPQNVNWPFTPHCAAQPARTPAERVIDQR